MSLVTLAKKTEAKKNISAHGFSIAGTVRGLNPTNKPRLMSSVRTPMKGVTAIGYGGCCGTYVRNMISTNRECCPSLGVANQTTAAIIEKKTRHLHWTADDQPLYYENHMRNIRVLSSCVATWQNKKHKSSEEGCSAATRIGSRLINRSTFFHEENGHRSCSDYTGTQLYKNNCLPTPSCKAPFPPPINPARCGVSAATPEEAIRLGLLPKNWGKCGKSSHFAINPYENA
jgi:hypothetical protein